MPARACGSRRWRRRRHRTLASTQAVACKRRQNARQRLIRHLRKGETHAPENMETKQKPTENDKGFVEVRRDVIPDLGH
eukprot:3047318-Rhodomonas_salina.3